MSMQCVCSKFKIISTNVKMAIAMAKDWPSDVFGRIVGTSAFDQHATRTI